MSALSNIGERSENLSPEAFVFSLISEEIGSADRIAAIQHELESARGPKFRSAMAGWVLQFLPVEALVPPTYARWRPLVHDAMAFMLSRLSTPRLAPKLAEQIALPLNTRPEIRLLRLISKVPGLQKLGQVLARNRHLPSPLRRALSELENGISDVDSELVRAVIREQLPEQLPTYEVEIESSVFFEGSVSAVIRFTWHNPELQQRERGVFKVLKPHIPECFAEDMQLLAQLAKYLGSRHREYGFAPHVLPDTFNDVRRLLQHEVQFTREQASLIEASLLYQARADVRVPRVIRQLCTSKITALTAERGKKVTAAVMRMPAWRRARVSEQLVDALIAIPLFAPKGDVMFHADPHAGNLLYDGHRGELIILDWALTERLTVSERRHLAMLFFMILLRDPVGASEAIEALCTRKGRRERHKRTTIRQCVNSFIAELPVKRVPGAVEAMNLLERIAFAGIRLPISLVMFRKALFTLDGILHDIGAPDFSIESVIGRHILQNWLTNWKGLGLPLSLADWMFVQCSALLFPGRLLLQGAQNMLQRTETSKISVPAGANSTSSPAGEGPTVGLPN